MTIPTPVEIDDVTLAFPANALEFMPAWEDIPDDFKQGNDWTRFANTWFNAGLSQRFSFQSVAIDDKRIDASKVYRQLRAIMGSYAPKHEHKIASVGYLASLWMESMIYGRPDTPDDQLTALGEAKLEEWLEYFAEADKEGVNE